MPQAEAERPDDMRGCGEQPFAFEQCFPNQSKLIIFKISQSAMDQLGTGGGCGPREVTLLAQNCRRAAACHVAPDPRTVHAAADPHDLVLPLLPLSPNAP